jgi:hypothetical protein
MTLMNPINGMLVNTTLINAGTLQLGALTADAIVDLLTQGNVIMTTGVTVNAVAEFLANTIVRIQSHEVPMWAEASMTNRDIREIIPITDVGTNIVSRVTMYKLPFDIIIRGVLIEAATDMEAKQTVGRIGVTSIEAVTHMDDTEADILQRAWFCEAGTDMIVPVVIGQLGAVEIEAIAETQPWGNVISENATVIEAGHEWPVVDVIIKVGDAIKLYDCNCDCPVYGPNLTFPPEGCDINGNSICKQCGNDTF